MKRKVIVFALDGIGGCGKSHVARLITERLEQEGISVINGKIAGLGDSPRGQQLKAIKDHRFGLISEGKATAKQIEDQRRDRIFRLAIRHQVNNFISMRDNGYDLAVLDRTPLMSWVFSAASYPENPYLNEILEESIENTEKLGLSQVFLLDVSVETAYARIIARSCVGKTDDDIELLILEACRIIGANKCSTERIIVQVARLLSHIH